MGLDYKLYNRWVLQYGAASAESSEYQLLKLPPQLKEAVGTDLGDVYFIKKRWRPRQVPDESLPFEKEPGGFRFYIDLGSGGGYRELIDY